MSVNEPVLGPHEFITWREDVMKNINAGGYEPYEFSDPRNLPSDISLEQWMAYDGSSGDPVTVWLQRLNMQPPEIENRSEEHTSELQSLMRISYAVFCLKKKK